MDDSFLDMSSEEMKELLVEFLAEGDSHLQVLNAKLLLAEGAIKNGVEMSDEDMNAMFRAAHTIKGTASFIGLKKIVGLTHEMETILQRVKEKEMVLSLKIVDVLFVAFDMLETLFSTLRDQGDEDGDITESVRLIKEVLNSETVSTDAEESLQADKHVATDEISEPGELEKSEDESLSEAKEIPVNQKYLQQFIVDAEENIEVFNNALMTYEEDKDNTEHINVLFRSMHTIKGSSGIVDAVDIQSVAHGMENVLSFYREKQATPDEQVISLLFEGIDAIRGLVEVLKNGGGNGADLRTILKKLDDLVQKNKTKEVCPAEAKKEERTDAVSDAPVSPQGEDSDEAEIYTIVYQVEAIIFAKKMKVVLVEERLSKIGEIIEQVPVFDDIDEDSQSAISVTVVLCTTKNREEIADLLRIDGVSVEVIAKKTEVGSPGPVRPPVPTSTPVEKKKDEREVKPEKEVSQASEAKKEKKSPVSSPASAAAKASPIEISTIRVDSHKIDNLMNLSGELVITRARFSQLVANLNTEISEQKELLNTVHDVQGCNETLSKETKLAGAETVTDKKVMKVIAEMEHKLVNLEQKIAKSRITSMIHSLDEITGLLGKISSDIQSGVMQTRMIAIEGIFTRFKRVVRDISKALKKDVNLKIEGEDTELDKKIVDSLGDPLTHMIRNAVDHGIEDAQTRQAAGKPESGTVFLRASHKGNNICIDVGDDGKGLDADKVVASAIKKEIITEEQAARLNDKEKLDLIFSPGFSTAEKITNVSGRGVGMDVVRNMITSVNGTVDIETAVGKGTTFVLKIPLTLAIIQALLVVIGGETFAFPLDAVIEIIKVSMDDIYSIDGNDTVKLRGHALSIVELQGAIGLDGRSNDAVASKKIVVITDGENQLGIIVDDLIGEDEIVIKSLTDHFAGVKGITGASILGDGRIALILDPIAIVKESR